MVSIEIGSFWLVLIVGVFRFVGVATAGCYIYVLKGIASGMACTYSIMTAVPRTGRMLGLRVADACATCNCN